MPICVISRVFVILCNQDFVLLVYLFYSTIDATACPITYQAVLTVTGFTKAHSGTYTLTVENRAGSITQRFQRILEG